MADQIRIVTFGTVRHRSLPLGLSDGHLRLATLRPLSLLIKTRDMSRCLASSFEGALLTVVPHPGRIPFFDSFLACFSLRFSFSDLPTFLALC